MPELRLHRDPFGRLVFTAADGEAHAGVLPVRAFPVSAPEQGLALVSAEGHELAWIESLAALPQEARDLIAAELASREFTPEIRRIREVSGFATPCTWEVDTDRGPTSFVLKAEDDIRRLAGNALLIADKHGIQFLIRDAQALDKKSRRLLDLFF